MKRKILFPILIMISSFFAYAQKPADHLSATAYEQKLRLLFQEWERGDRPGGVVAVFEKGAVVYKNCFGLANLEYQLANTPQTVFDACSLAEPVTGMAIAMLEEQGQLSPGEKITKYLPELAGYADSITVAHLLFQTSGLIDWFDLISLAGWNEEDAISFDQVLRVLKRQKKLLFEPGSKYLYSRTNYALLAELVKRATGQSFRDWTWENIFKPLRMTRTLFHDNSREIVENRAYSINYHSRDGYLKGADNLSVVGSNSLFTTLDDLIKWFLNFLNPRIGSAAVRDKMVACGLLSDRKEAGHSYGFRVDTNGGLKRLYKTGAWGGFRSALQYYPDVSFGVVILSNWDYGWNNPLSAAEAVVRVCLEPYLKNEKKEESPPEKTKEIRLKPDILSRYEGEYRLRPGSYIKIFRQDKDLFGQIPGSQKTRLVPVAESEFIIENQSAHMVFQRDQMGQVCRLVIQAGIQEVNAPKVKKADLSPEQLKLYEGTYANEELDARYEISAKGSKLVLANLRKKEIILTPENQKYFNGDSPLFNLIAFLTDEKNEMIGFQIEADHLRHFLFKKIAGRPSS